MILHPSYTTEHAPLPVKERRGEVGLGEGGEWKREGEGEGRGGREGEGRGWGGGRKRMEG